MSKEWAIIQQRYYQLLKSRRTGIRWTIALIKMLWDVAWELWEHRNEVLHEKENATSESALQRLNCEPSRLHVELSALSFANHDRFITAQSVSGLLATSAIHCKEWIRQARVVISSTRRSQWLARTKEEREF